MRTHRICTSRTLIDKRRGGVRVPFQGSRLLQNVGSAIYFRAQMQYVEPLTFLALSGFLGLEVHEWFQTMVTRVCIYFFHFSSLLIFSSP